MYVIHFVGCMSIIRFKYESIKLIYHLVLSFRHSKLFETRLSKKYQFVPEITLTFYVGWIS